MASITFLGHGSCKLRTAAGHVVYVDPFMSPEGQDSEVGYEDAADLILVTHQHYDHTATDKMAHAPGCVVWQNSDAHPAPGTYLTREFLGGEVTVEAVPAYNKIHNARECVGYVVSCDGALIYFSGDTGPTAEMADLAARGLDVAFLPTDGIYTMSAEEAARCAATIGAKISVPIHTKPVTPYGDDVAARFARACPTAELVRPAETIEL